MYLGSDAQPQQFQVNLSTSTCCTCYGLYSLTRNHKSTFGLIQWEHFNSVVPGVRGTVHFLLVEVGWWDLRDYTVCEKH